MISIDVVARTKVVGGEAEKLLYTSDDFCAPGMKGPVEVLRCWRGISKCKRGDTLEEGIEQGRN